MDVFTRWVEACHRSIVDGSPVTGAPGQPVLSGALRRSWQIHYLTPLVAEIRTRLWHYAPQIEDGIRVTVHGQQPMAQRSAVGGFHSVKLTIAGAHRLLEQVLRETPDA